MANNTGTLVTATVRPFSDADNFPVAYGNELLGSYKTVADITARNAIPTERREEGNKVYVISEEITYKLKGGLTNSNWVQSSIEIDYVASYSLIDSSNKRKLTIVETDEIWEDTNTIYLKNNSILTKLITLQES